MKKTILTLIIISFLLISCDGYRQSSVSAEYLTSLNTEISDGQRSGAKWINSPERIARHLFPPESHDGGTRLYEVKKKMNSTTDCIVILTEEGAIDDEVSGERRTIQFQGSNGNWTITALKFEEKRS